MPAQQALDVEVLRLDRLRHRLVVDGQVVDDVLAVRVVVGGAVHPVEAVLHDVGDLVGERRVVVHDGGVGQGEQRRVPVGVLQTLAGQRRTAGRGADQEAAGQLVGHRPDRVAGALEAEHRVEDVERDHRLAVRGVRRARGRRGRDAARLGDALVEHLALRGLLPRQQQLAVDRLVELPGRVVDLGRAEHRVHAERAVLVGRDRHDPLADLVVLHQVLEQPDQRHRGGDLLLARALLQLVVHRVAGQRDLHAGSTRRIGHAAAERRAGGRGGTRAPRSPRPGGRTAPSRRTRSARRSPGRRSAARAGRGTPSASRRSASSSGGWRSCPRARRSSSP